MSFDKAPESTFGGFVFVGGNDSPYGSRCVLYNHGVISVGGFSIRPAQD